MTQREPEPATLTELEKRAYLYLLYQAMLDIRILCQPYRFAGLRDLSPLAWLRRWRESRAAGALADCLHNLAQFATWDFARFDTVEFWRRYESLCRRHPQFGAGTWMNYRSRYEEHLSRSQRDGAV